MNGEYKEYIELTAEVTGRRLIDELMKRLPCDKHMDRLEKVEKRISDSEHAVINQYNDIGEVRATSDTACTASHDVQKAVNGLWWKVFIAVVIPLAIFVLVQKWI